MVAARHSQFWILKLQSCPLCIFAVYADGSICLDILQNQWSPIYDVAAILTSIQVFPCKLFRHDLHYARIEV